MPGHENPDAPVDELQPDPLVTLYDRPEQYEIETLDGAAWALHDYGNATAALSELQQMRDAAVRDVTDWFDDRAHAVRRRLTASTILLTDWARRLRATGRKSLDTPWGAVATRARQPELALDELVFAAFQLRSTSVFVPVPIENEGTVLVELAADELLSKLDDALPLLRVTTKPNLAELRRRSSVVELLDDQLVERAPNGAAYVIDRVPDPETGEVVGSPRLLTDGELARLRLEVRMDGRAVEGVTALRQDASVTITPRATLAPPPLLGIVKAGHAVARDVEVTDGEA